MEFLQGLLAVILSISVYEINRWAWAKSLRLPTTNQLASLGRLIRAEARCTPHTQEWCKARDAVTVAAMQLADSIRGDSNE
jgi:hypothetical protein